MAKVTLVPIESGYLSTEALNENFQRLLDALENTLSRDGTLPNQLEADLDLNGNALLNSVPSDDPDALVRRQDVEDIVANRATGLLYQRVQQFAPASVGQTVFNLTDFSYTPGASTLAVYVNGERLFVTSGFTETGSDTFTLVAPLAGGEDVVAVSTDFLGTVILPVHTHTWSQITGIPAFATRWPDWTEVTGKPTTFTPASHVHSTADITSGAGLADARRGVWVQATQPTAGRVGEIWAW
jgi:hypothetical protein